MPIPATILPSYVAIVGAKSVQGFLGTQPPTLAFGVVDQVSSTPVGLVAVNDSVLFDTAKSIVISYQDIQYYLVKEEDCILVEDAPPPPL